MKIVSAKRLTGNRLRLHYEDHVGRKWSDVKGMKTMRDMVRLYLLSDPVALTVGEVLTLDRDGRPRVNDVPIVKVTGRPPIGKYAMTGAERARRFRERAKRLGIIKGK